MSNLIRCESCKGLKKTVGLGLIERDCDECKGVGWTNNKLEEPEDISELSSESDTAPSKRRRKK